MPQLHLYVSDEVAASLRQSAEEAGLSTSRYLAKIVTASVHPGWPEGYFDAVCGSCPDFPDPPPEPPESPIEPWA